MRVRLRQARRAKHDVVVAGHAKLALHAGADGVAHAAPAAVATGQKLRFDLLVFPGFQIAQGRHHRILALLKPEQFGVQAHLHTREGIEVAAHHLLQRVLRDPLGVFGIQRVAAGRAIQGVLETRQRVACEPRGEHHR